MKEKESYIISVKVIFSILLVLAVFTVFVAFFSAQYVVKRYLAKNPQNGRIIQTVQTNNSYQSFSDVVDSEKGNIVGILNDDGEIVQQGVVLTSDGLFITPLKNDIDRTVDVVLSDGNVVNSILVRTYPEKKIGFYKINRNFSTPHFSASENISVGVEGVLLGLKKKQPNMVAFPGLIKSIDTSLTKGDPIFGERLANFSTQPTKNFMGSALYNIKSKLMGIFIDYESANILPIGEIDLMLQDLLKHPDGQSVKVMNGLVGDWIENVSEQKKNAAFEVSAVDPKSVFYEAGLRKNDVIVSVNNRLFPSAELWATFLESARSVKSVSLGIQRGEEALKIQTNVIIQDGKE